ETLVAGVAPLGYAHTMRVLLVLSVVFTHSACSEDDPIGSDTAPDTVVDTADTVSPDTDVTPTCRAYDPLRRPLFGDLHVHTALSLD
ncbi:MAG TPA: hypothetical protein PK095_24020, partial [Myxococcota bacterium]|nr:hypothetical protein [Myxococcota bacterium]